MIFSQWWRNGYRGEQKPAIPTPPWSLRSELAHPKQWGEEECSASRAGVPMLQELMPDDLRGSWCSNNRNKVHNKCNALESSPKHSPPWLSVEKLSSMTLVPGAQKAGTATIRPSPAATPRSVKLQAVSPRPHRTPSLRHHYPGRSEHHGRKQLSVLPAQ